MIEKSIQKYIQKLKALEKTYISLKEKNFSESKIEVFEKLIKELVEQKNNLIKEIHKKNINENTELLLYDYLIKLYELTKKNLKEFDISNLKEINFLIEKLSNEGIKNLINLLNFFPNEREYFVHLIYDLNFSQETYKYAKIVSKYYDIKKTLSDDINFSADKYHCRTVIKKLYENSSFLALEFFLNHFRKDQKNYLLLSSIDFLEELKTNEKLIKKFFFRFKSEIIEELEKFDYSNKLLYFDSIPEYYQKIQLIDSINWLNDKEKFLILSLYEFHFFETLFDINTAYTFIKKLKAIESDYLRVFSYCYLVSEAVRQTNDYNNKLFLILAEKKNIINDKTIKRLKEDRLLEPLLKIVSSKMRITFEKEIFYFWLKNSLLRKNIKWILDKDLTDLDLKAFIFGLISLKECQIPNKDKILNELPKKLNLFINQNKLKSEFLRLAEEDVKKLIFYLELELNKSGLRKKKKLL